MQKGLIPYQYIICQKRQLVALKEQIRAAHKGLKPHQCLICQKSFGLPGNLNRHIRMVHKGLQPHQCQN